MKLNERLKTARTDNDFTQQEVADALKISRSTVSSWEVGRTLPSLDYIIDLSNLYNLSLDILLKEDMVMVNQVNKEMKSKKIYKGIVIGVGLLLILFILINSIWLFNVSNKYSYLDKNWEFKNSTYYYKEDDIYMTVQKFSIRDEFKFFYLKNEPLSVSATIGDESVKDYQPNVFVREKDYVLADVPINEKHSSYAPIKIDKDGKIYPGENNPAIGLDFEANRMVVNEVLEKNSDDFKLLYKKANEQFKLVNQLKAN